MLQFRKPELAEVARDLGLTDEALQGCLTGAQSPEEANTRLEALKRDVRKAFHARALACHPDRHPEKADDFKKLSGAWNDIEAFLANLAVRRQAPRPMPMPFPFPFPFAAPFSTGTTATTSSSTYGGFVTTVFVVAL